MDDKKLASSARRDIEKAKDAESTELYEELKRKEKKMYYEEIRHKSYANVKDKFFFGVAINGTLALALRSVVIFPIGFGAFSVFQVMRAWWSTPRPTYSYKLN